MPYRSVILSAALKKRRANVERKVLSDRSSYQKDIFEWDYWGDGESLYIVEVERDPKADPLSRCWEVSVWYDGSARVRLPRRKTGLDGIEAFRYAAELQAVILPALIVDAKKRHAKE